MSKKRKRFVLYYDNFEKEHLGKDVFLVPYNINKLYGFDIIIVYSQTITNKNFSTTYRGIKLKPLGKNILGITHINFIKNFLFLIYLIINARKIDILCLFNIYPLTMIFSTIHKILNPKGFLYVKADMGPQSIEYHLLRSQGIKKRLVKRFVKLTNLFTIESKLGCRLMKQVVKKEFEDKIQWMMDFFDEKEFEKSGIKIKDITQKENIILTVGRLGSREKNTEMILKAASKVDFKKWKLICVGPVEKNKIDFNEYINDFYINNTKLKNKVIFTGPIYNKKELYEIYNKSKVFLLPSRWESFGIVLVEALKFRNYIISTDVGGATDIINMGYGEFIPQEDETYLSKIIQRLIDNEDYIKKEYEKISWNDIDVSGETIVKNATEKFFKGL
ncbi:MAG: glycosyltransferase [Methanobrevibacter sp.]|jgi:glycosyltransferase involved in cell wall biosynthesis|nr:glycosyltransferase [Candidatus Methanovirga procula]